MSEKRSIEDILSLVEQNFEFLHVGKFLSYCIKQHDLSLEAKDLDLQLGGVDIPFVAILQEKSCAMPLQTRRNKPSLCWAISLNGMRSEALPWQWLRE